MNPYDKYILPKLTDWVCSAGRVSKQRLQVVPMASGQVLEVGIGSGRNLPFYDPRKVDRLYGVDPSAEMWKLSGGETDRYSFPVEFLRASAETIPLEAGSVDSVVVTYSLCTIPDVAGALREMRRVLRADGNLYFCEHGLSPDPEVSRWQRRLNPIWKRLGGGCHLDRDIPTLIRAGGFIIDDIKAMYIPGWKAACYNFLGTARPIS